MAGVLGLGGAATLANTTSSAAPALLYQRQSAAGAGVDGGAFQGYSICNTGTTNGVTASTDWLYVLVVGLNGAAAAVTALILLPGERHIFKKGFNGNGIETIYAWTRAAGGGSGAAGNLVVIGGGFAQN